MIISGVLIADHYDSETWSIARDTRMIEKKRDWPFVWCKNTLVGSVGCDEVIDMTETESLENRN